jgi:hypothetical protein
MTDAGGTLPSFAVSFVLYLALASLPSGRVEEA